MTSKTPQSSKNKKSRPKLKLKSLLWGLKLCCPTCGNTKLVQSGAFLKFNDGCKSCDYTFEREPGYFWGQSMMISYPLIGLFLVLVGYVTKSFFPSLSAYALAIILSIISIPLIVVLNPHSRVIWMIIDLYFNPLNEKDQLQK